MSSSCIHHVFIKQNLPVSFPTSKLKRRFGSPLTGVSSPTRLARLAPRREHVLIAKPWTTIAQNWEIMGDIYIWYIYIYDIYIYIYINSIIKISTENDVWWYMDVSELLWTWYFPLFLKNTNEGEKTKTSTCPGEQPSPMLKEIVGLPCGRGRHTEGSGQPIDP